METVDIRDLPVFMPGNNRNWHNIQGRAQITEDGQMIISFVDPKSAEALVDMARRNILMQVSLDYRTPKDRLEKINKQFAMEYHDENTLVKVRKALMDVFANVSVQAGRVTVDDAINALQNAGILFRERK